MVLITLAIAGAVLAHQKIEKRKEARSLAQEQAQRLQREEEAFAELQTYANFQTSLSSKVLDDIETESLHAASEYYRHSNSTFDFNLSGQADGDDGGSVNEGREIEGRGPPPRYSYAMRGRQIPLLLPSIENDDQVHGDDEKMLVDEMEVTGSIDLPSEYGQRSRAQLSSPLIISQEIDPTGTHGWTRAYSPSLMGCGISHSSFLDFIDSFNAFLQTSPNIPIINIASLSTPFPITLPSPNLLIANDLAAKLPHAAHASKLMSASQRNIFLSLANEALFTPNGLLAMVISYRPDTTESVITMDFNHSHVHNSKVDAALSLLALNARSESKLSDRNSYASSEENRFSTGSEFGPLHPIRSNSQTQHNPQLITPIPRELSSNSLQTLVSNVSAAHDRRKDSRRLKKRHNNVLGTGLGMGLGNISGSSVRIEKTRPVSVSSFSSGLSGRMGNMGLGSSSGVRDSMSSIRSSRRIEEFGPEFKLQPGALYLVIVNDPSPDRS